MRSVDYEADLYAARAVWEPSRIIGGAGMFVFATYATLPVLTSVGPPGGDDALMLRKTVGVKREKDMLTRLLGLDAAGEQSGLANATVRRMLTDLGVRHGALVGMKPEYLDIFARIISIAPIRLRLLLGQSLDDQTYNRYWRYMTHSLHLFGADLGDRVNAQTSCRRFVAANTEPGPRTASYVKQLYASHPRHMRTSRDALFPETRRVIDGRCSLR